jgi:hypothetical protein
MTTSTLFHTQGIRGFKYEKTHRKNGTEYYYVRSSAAHLDCPDCKCTETTIVETGKRREISGLHVGLKKDNIPSESSTNTLFAVQLQYPGAHYFLRRPLLEA